MRQLIFFDTRIRADLLFSVPEALQMPAISVSICFSNSSAAFLGTPFGYAGNRWGGVKLYLTFPASCHSVFLLAILSSFFRNNPQRLHKTRNLFCLKIYTIRVLSCSEEKKIFQPYQKHSRLYPLPHHCKKRHQRILRHRYAVQNN